MSRLSLNIGLIPHARLATAGVVVPTLTLSPSSLTAGTSGTAYSQQLTASGGTAPYTYAVTSGALPTGLTLSSAGLLSGTPSVSGSFNFTITATDAAGTPVTGSRPYSLVLAAAGDVTAPTLSSPTGTQTGSTTGTSTVSTNEANGTLYAFLSTSSTPPTAANLKTGTGAVTSASQTVSATGTQTVNWVSLTASTTYYTHWLHRDAAGNDSAIVSGAGFTTAAAAATAAGYLSTAVAPYTAYGAQRLVSGYSGPIYRVRRSDATELDVSCATGSDYPDYTALNTWANGSALTVPTIYDQSGNARHMTQTTVANQPTLNTAFVTNNCVPILIDGITAPAGGQTAIAKTPQVGGLTLDVISNSAFLAVAPQVSQNPTAMFELDSEDTLTQSLQFYASGQTATLRVNGANLGSTTAVNGPLPRAMLDVIGYTSSASTSVFWGNDAQKSQVAAKTSTSVPRIRMGVATAGGTGFASKNKLFGFAVYNTTLSSADGDAVNASLKTAFGVSRAYPYRVVFDGDSIMEGTGSTNLKNMVNQMVFTKNAEIFNTGIHGQTLATDYTNRAKFTPLYTASYPCVIFLEAGTNDLAASTTGSALYTTMTNLVTSLKTTGFKVVVCTVLPRAGLTAPQEAERQTYNTAVLGNAAAADLVLDINANASMGGAQSQASNTTYYNSDGTHPNNNGYATLAPLYQVALQTVLRTTALGGSYIP